MWRKSIGNPAESTGTKSRNIISIFSCRTICFLKISVEIHLNPFKKVNQKSFQGISKLGLFHCNESNIFSCWKSTSTNNNIQNVALLFTINFMSSLIFIIMILIITEVGFYVKGECEKALCLEI